VIRLGLTGAIASGKSTALEAFSARGVPTFSSDAAVHALYQGEAVPVVERLFPGVTNSGKVDRAELSRRLVAHPEKLRALESAIHPLVRDRMQKFLTKAAADGAHLAVADVPLLYETGFDYGFDKVVVTAAPDDIISARALARPGMSVEKLAAILARQLPQAEKQRRADYVIDTSGSLADTGAQVARIVEALASEDS
jgi:dephospho-CoA kinase